MKKETYEKSLENRIVIKREIILNTMFTFVILSTLSMLFDL